MLYIRLPDAQGRFAIFQKHARKTPISPLVNLKLLSENPKTEGFSGADCAALVREATVQALCEARDMLFAKDAKKSKNEQAEAATALGLGREMTVCVTAAHFEFALTKVLPSVSVATVKKYDRMQATLSKARGVGTMAGEGGDIAVVEDKGRKQQV